MKLGDSLSQSHDVQARITLLEAANAGKMENLPCPQCNELCVSVWFTHPTKDEYRTWFTCLKCGFEMRAQNSGRPPYYSAERDRTGGVEALLSSEQRN
jgi:RNase P subunit RPR2